MYLKSFCSKYRIYTTLLVFVLFCMFESSKKQIYVNLEPYYNSYTLEAGKEFRMPDTLFITPALQKGESYMYNEIDNFAFRPE